MHAAILLTTSHKSNHSIAEWRKIFESRGSKVGNIGCLPESLYNISRIDKILNWFDSNSAKDDFIIIDDDKSLNALPIFLKERLVQTSAMIGLTDNLATAAFTQINFTLIFE
jgi:hypothetical protein